MLSLLREETEGKLQTLLSLRKNGLRVFTLRRLSHRNKIHKSFRRKGRKNEASQDSPGLPLATEDVVN